MAEGRSSRREGRKRVRSIGTPASRIFRKEREILASIGAGSEQIAEGSIAALEKTISALKTKYKEAATDTERTALLKQIQEQEALLKKIDLTGHRYRRR